MFSLAPQSFPVMMPGAAAPAKTFPPPGAVTPFKPAPAVSAALAAGAPLPAPAKVRAQNDDAPAAPPRLVMPSPEALGLGVTKAEPTAPAIDWNFTHQRLKELGAVGFHLDRLATGQVRVTFWLPTAEPDRTRLVESTATSEAEAVSLALRQASTMR